MRKLAKLAIAMTVVMSMGITAMAAGSISTTYSFSGATDDSGNAIELTVAAATETVTAADAVAAIAAASDISIATEDAVVIIQEITAPEGAEFPLTITLSVGGVTADSTVAVLHYTEGAWEYVAATAGDGVVSFTVSSLSPIAVVVEGTSTTSPETGEASMVSIMMIAAVALGTAFVVSKRKVA